MNLEITNELRFRKKKQQPKKLDEKAEWKERERNISNNIELFCNLVKQQRNRM